MNTFTTRFGRPAAASDPSQSPAGRGRRPELDWLRTLIVLSIIPYHALLLFVTVGASIIAHPISMPLAPIVYNAVDIWGISLIFLLSGAASRFALAVRSPRAYVTERLLRLGVPAVLVVLLLAPLLAYFLLLSNPSLASAGPRPIADPEQLRHIGTFFLQYWRNLFTTGTPIVIRNVLVHLWFVPRLVIVSLICLPLFLFLQEDLAALVYTPRSLAPRRRPVGAGRRSHTGGCGYRAPARMAQPADFVLTADGRLDDLLS